jgi:hypothetical protein
VVGCLFGQVGDLDFFLVVFGGAVAVGAASFDAREICLLRDEVRDLPAALLIRDRFD